jgi:hypothetical protein
MGAATLERRYRRMLACFPAGHRRVYGEEMVGVLLASARPGQRRPDAADTLDLIGGGLLARWHRLRFGEYGAEWRDALAVFAVTAPFLLVVQMTLMYAVIGASQFPPAALLTDFITDVG